MQRCSVQPSDLLFDAPVLAVAHRDVLPGAFDVNNQFRLSPLQ